MRLYLSMVLCLSWTFAWGDPIQFDQLKVGSTLYRNVTVLSISETDVYFRHEDGVANARLRRLEPQAQKALGYDAERAAEAERQRSISEQQYHSNIVASMVTADSAKSSGEAKRQASENALSDPISDKSLIGKPAPAIDYGAWENLESPSGKFVVLMFWAPWSVPSQRAIGPLEALQEKFPQRLLLLGVNVDPQAAMNSGRIGLPKFPMAPDAEGKIAAAAGATCLPFVLLIDPDGKVVYQGHPAALTEAALARLLKQE